MIRLAVLNDQSAMAAIAGRAYERYVQLIGKRPAPMDANFGLHINRAEAYVDETDGNICGFIVQFGTPEGWFIENVAVDPTLQGRGLGQEMLSDAEQRCQQAGKDRVYLYTNEAMTETCAWYLKNGYSETHRIMESGFNRIYLEKRIAP
ncbi:MAG: GNAT family N-acetyltransferase [Rhodospirillales bacterium]|jgi:ribosomal protein S18 acetylase RimI-like enzyme|nr:GNAT family N-acetyltransferase [Rhodospirillales bacterium]MBT4038438.1 GNAT family N-acetyltransferase [Rhodospirillales bacterium]MBT4625693.1 GNAT family N-acetyltransferase [Rhodospirillales bacterium]MBT5352359.1 GNAT family N-acetyltransferase [Rhodospirillales bacterium]MBT5519805.1 GNAT family N-acetyltransferase [Rhodospirillales bacterium]